MALFASAGETGVSAVAVGETAVATLVVVARHGPGVDRLSRKRAEKSPC